MGDSPGSASPSPSPNFHKTLGIPKNSSLKDIKKAYQSLVKKWQPDKHLNNKVEAEAKLRDINEAYHFLKNRKTEEDYKHENDPSTSNGLSHAETTDESFFTRLRSKTPTRLATFSRNLSRRSTTPTPEFFRTPPSGGTTPTTPHTPPELEVEALRALARATSRGAPTPIIFSGSSTRKKPPPIEKRLACTLEELSDGCIKKIKITRDVLSDFGIIVQEEETLKLKIKPGWKKGTKITFEGKGDEKPGFLPADLTYIIDEKRHPIFKRDGDDLALGVEIPLVKALTGCNISVPLLGGGEISLSFDEIIYPGFEKLIWGQGMPKPREEGKRGDLRLKFFVNFPSDLSDDLRSEIVGILGDCS